MNRVRVWDLPTRVFHWTLALAVIGLVVSAKVGGTWMNWHLRLGHLVLALLVFRVLWGLFGGHWSRFGSFSYGPRRLAAYLAGRAGPDEEVGHSPLGALSVLVMLLVLGLQVGSGLFSDDEIAFFGPLVSQVSNANVALATWYHKSVGQWLVLALVVIHIAAIAYYQWAKKQALVGPMVSGDKFLASAAKPSQDGWAQRLLALALFAACAALARWVYGLGAPAF